MIHRMLSCLLVGALCCALVGCSAKPGEPVSKTPEKNPMEAAKAIGESPTGATVD